MSHPETTAERIHVLRDMEEHEHVEQAYQLIARASDHTRPWEQQGVDASLAVAHLLLAADKQRDPRYTLNGRR